MQALSNLAVGSKIWINESGTPTLYEIAGFDVHASNSATIVRSSAKSTTPAYMKWGDDNEIYSTSELDAWMQNFESVYDLYHKAALINTSIVCATGSATSETLIRRIFALSNTELTGTATQSINENSQLSYYTTAANRIKTTSPQTWWTRSIPSTTNAYYVNSSGLIASYARIGTYPNVVPAFVISSAINASDAESSGAYNIYFPDAIPTATPVSPVSSYIETGSENTFEWTHSLYTSTAQTRADLECKEYGGEWAELVTITGSAHTAALPANTFSAGRFFWRVRTYNQDDTAGAWSTDTAFVCVGAPLAPTITGISQCSRPVVSWTSSGQIAYRVQIGTNDTLEVAGTAMSFKLPHYIANGTYAVKVAIKNASLVWSAWAEAELVLNVTGPSAPTITATASTGYATLSLSASGASKLYLLRGGVPIADVTGLSSYVDHAALGSVSYVLRSVDSSDNYTDSTAATATVSVPYATIAAVDALSSKAVLKLTRGEPRRLSGSIGQTVTYKRYAGRTKPVAVYSGQEDEAYQLSVAFLTKTEKDAFIALLRRRKTILYRDNWGNKWYVSIPTTGYEQDKIATSFPITMTVVDYAEEISYAGV